MHWKQLTSDKHGSAAGNFPCMVFHQAAVGSSILWQGLLHHEAHLPPVDVGLPKESHFTCRREQAKEQMQQGWERIMDQLLEKWASWSLNAILFLQILLKRLQTTS